MFYLGVDGGGTGCRVAVARKDGHIIAEATGGPANINTDVTLAASNILDATQRALAGHDIALSQLNAVLGLAGGSISGAAARLRALLPFRDAVIVNDAVVVARGALGRDDGILAAMGTGSVFAVQQGGRVTQYGGRGFLLGDEGGGAVLGRSLLAMAVRAADGFAPMTPLLTEVLEQFGGIEGIILFANRATPAQFATLAPRLATDDPAARQIVKKACETIRSRIACLQQPRPLPVVFTGGLGTFYAQRLHGLWPITSARGSGVDGALAIARETVFKDHP